LVKPLLMGKLGPDTVISGVLGLVLMILSLFLIAETCRALRKKEGAGEAK